jgi:hypothetical protein
MLDHLASTVGPGVRMGSSELRLHTVGVAWTAHLVLRTQGAADSFVCTRSVCPPTAGFFVLPPKNKRT